MKRNVEKWLEMLESGQYNHKDTYCCLGVLCEPIVNKRTIKSFIFKITRSVRKILGKDWR